MVPGAVLPTLPLNIGTHFNYL